MVFPRAPTTATWVRCAVWPRTPAAPDGFSGAEVQGYFEYLLTECQLAPAGVRLADQGVRFLDREVLAWPPLDLGVARPKRPRRIPELLTRAEVGAILAAFADVRYRAMLTLC